MEIQIIETPIQFRLCGKAGAVPNQNYGEVGMGLMDEMWKAVKGSNTPNTGINHWVYLEDGRMFVGVELKDNANPPAGLEPLEFELAPYMKHLHIGPYQLLPEKWKALKAELAARGETMSLPALEVYGHHCEGEDSSKLETTILIGLQPR